MVDGFRNQEIKDKALKNIRNTATEEELKRLKEQREFLNLEEGTYAYKIALHLDSIRQTILKHKLSVDKTLWSIGNTNNQVLRLEAQLKSGKITEILKDDTVMNEYELKSNIEYMKWCNSIEVNEIPKLLSQIRMLTGHKDLLGNIIMTNEYFEAYAEEVILKVKELGHEVF